MGLSLVCANTVGFPDIVIRWIKECITTPRFSISINGELNGFFAVGRGLRHCDPLSLTKGAGPCVSVQTKDIGLFAETRKMVTESPIELATRSISETRANPLFGTQIYN
ncbi:hypothetical protein SLA2020_277280 [Shorea laevis]